MHYFWDLIKLRFISLCFLDLHVQKICVVSVNVPHKTEISIGL